MFARHREAIEKAKAAQKYFEPYPVGSWVHWRQQGEDHFGEVVNIRIGAWGRKIFVCADHDKNHKIVPFSKCYVYAEEFIGIG